METLDLIRRQGKALYIGLSNYDTGQTKVAVHILESLGTRCLIPQPKYSMFNRWVEGELLDLLESKGIGCIPFSPLAQGLLTNKYIQGIPEDSRAAKAHGFLKKPEIADDVLQKVRLLNELAGERDQSLAQMALSWLIKDKRITSVLIGASSVKQLNENLQCLENTGFSTAELERIEKILGS
jgi:L-glyceraldehyde 3-phosphate reductase